jgi:hypothetical protein
MRAGNREKGNATLGVLKNAPHKCLRRSLAKLSPCFCFANFQTQLLPASAKQETIRFAATLTGMVPY